MLNISNNRIHNYVDSSRFKSMTIFADNKHYKIIRKVVWGVFIAMVLVLFLPWTQNIKGSGFVTTLKPGQRPQAVHAIIGGRIEAWYVQEGDFVKKLSLEHGINFKDTYNPEDSEAHGRPVALGASPAAAGV